MLDRTRLETSVRKEPVLFGHIQNMFEVQISNFEQHKIGKTREKSWISH